MLAINLLLHFIHSFLMVRQTRLNFKLFPVGRYCLINRDLLTWAWSAVLWRLSFFWHVILCDKINEAKFSFRFSLPIASFIACLSQSFSLFCCNISSKVFHGMHPLPKIFQEEDKLARGWKFSKIFRGLVLLGDLTYSEKFEVMLPYLGGTTLIAN